MRDRLTRALTAGAHRQEFSPGYATELELWTRRYSAARDGIPTTSIAPLPVGGAAATPLRRFPHGQLPQPRILAGKDPTTTQRSRSSSPPPATSPRPARAGEATSAVLLAATGLGLATTPLSQGFEIDATRRAIQTTVLHVPEHPQLLLRIGWPAPTAAELAPTPRRDCDRSCCRPDPRVHNPSGATAPSPGCGPRRTTREPRGPSQPSRRVPHVPSAPPQPASLVARRRKRACRYYSRPILVGCCESM